MDKPICSELACGSPASVKGMCKRHYDRTGYLRRTPNATRLEPGNGTCEHCGESVERRKTGPMPRYCAIDCRRRAEYARNSEATLARQAAAAKARRMVPKPCKQCAAPFTPAKSMAQIFCSSACGSRFHRDSATKTCSVEGCEKPHRAKGFCGHHYTANSPKAKQWKKGRPETRRAGLRRKTQMRRALMRDPDAQDIDRDEIGIRDGWRCGLCQRRVNRNLPYPNPMSASLDHIVPLSKGGKHASENVQISHLRCNMAKGNRGGGEQLILIG